MYCDQQQAEHIDIISATHGRLDHALYNLRLLRKQYHHERRLLLHTKDEQCEYIKDQRVVINAAQGARYCDYGVPASNLDFTRFAI